jgi:hypothetical protein
MSLGPVSAQAYKWVDENGVAHYGERPQEGRNVSEVPCKLGTPPPAEKGERALADSTERDTALAKWEQAVLVVCGT